jgi:phosphate/sulfate permease
MMVSRIVRTWVLTLPSAAVLGGLSVAVIQLFV